MDKAKRKEEMAREVEKAFWASVGGGKGQAFERLVDFIVDLEERVEKLEQQAHHDAP